MKKAGLTIVFIVLLAAVGAGYMQWQKSQRGSVDLPAITEAPPVQNEPTEPRYPISAALPLAGGADGQPSLEQDGAESSADAPMDEALPDLNESTPVIAENLSNLSAEGWIPEMFKPDEIIRRFVVTVDNLPNRKLPQQHLLVNPTAGVFLVTGEGDEKLISPDNAARYTPFVQMAESLDTHDMIALYVKYYPLFQEAYAELGKPGAYFNDRLIEVIDQLLSTPSVEGPIRLVRPKVLYEYADPELEALSAGQKVLLRMGSANAELIKAKLRELRQALTHEAPPQ